AGVAAELRDDRVTDTEIVFELPAAVPAGVHAVQVIQPRLVGTPPEERAAAESNVVPLVVRPTVTAVATAPGAAQDSVDVSVTLDPPVGAQQRVVLILNEHQAAAGNVPRGYSFVAPARTASAATVTVSAR